MLEGAKAAAAAAGVATEQPGAQIENDPTGPCTSIVYTLALKSSLEKVLWGQCIYYLGTWTLGVRV